MRKAVAALIFLAPSFTEPAPAAEAVDLELVLAVDASSSIDIGEYALQLRGIAGGFRDPAVRSAIRSGPKRRIAVNLVVWAEQKFAKLATGWQVIGSDAEAEAFAVLVESLPRRQFGGTGIGEGLSFAVEVIKSNGIEAARRVIDVSGDGRETTSEGAVLLPEARRAALSAGITVNGLAVIDEDRELLDYFRQHLIAGRDSFAMAANDYVDFARAMRVKLYREIEARPMVAAAARTARKRLMR